MLLDGGGVVPSQAECVKKHNANSKEVTIVQLEICSGDVLRACEVMSPRPCLGYKEKGESRGFWDKRFGSIHSRMKSSCLGTVL